MHVEALKHTDAFAKPVLYMLKHCKLHFACETNYIVLLPIWVPILLRWYLPLSVPIPPDDTCRYGYNNFNPYKPQMHLTRAVNNRRAFANCYMHITRNRLRHLKLQDAYHTRAVHKLRHRYLLKACHTGGSHTAAGPSTTRSFTVSPPPHHHRLNRHFYLYSLLMLLWSTSSLLSSLSEL